MNKMHILLDNLYPFSKCKRVLISTEGVIQIGLRQKAKVKWAKKGDCNTSFFHRVASSRKSKNHIGSLLLESGVRNSDDREIEEEILWFFRSFIVQ